MYPGMKIDPLDQASMARAFYEMLFNTRAPRAEFNQVIHDDFELEDVPVAVKVEGREVFWSAVDVPIEGKHALCFDSEFVEYVGSPDEGNARWKFRPAAGYAGVLWGIDEVNNYAAEDAPEIEVVARIKFRDGKIRSVKETWDPSPLLRKAGVGIPLPGAVARQL